VNMTLLHAQYLNERHIKDLSRTMTRDELHCLALDTQGGTSRHAAKQALNFEYFKLYGKVKGHRLVAITAIDSARLSTHIPETLRHELAMVPAASKFDYLPGILYFAPGLTGFNKANLATIYAFYNGAPIIVLELNLDPREDLSWDKDPSLPPHNLKYMPLGMKIRFLKTYRPATKTTPNPADVWIKPTKKTFKWTSKDNTPLTVTRVQFKINLGNFGTDYSHQGETYDRFIVDGRPKDTKPNGLNLYVLLGRVTTHAGMYLLEKIDLKHLKEKLSHHYVTAMEHFTKQDRKARKDLKASFDKVFPNYAKTPGNIAYMPEDRPQPEPFHVMYKRARPDHEAKDAAPKSTTVSQSATSSDASSSVSSSLSSSAASNTKQRRKPLGGSSFIDRFKALGVGTDIPPAPGPASTPRGPDPLATSWVCANCSLLCTAETSVCTMCLVPRDAAPQASAPETQAAEQNTQPQATIAEASPTKNLARLVSERENSGNKHRKRPRVVNLFK
jgi:hypothetical protein